MYGLKPVPFAGFADVSISKPRGPKASTGRHQR